MTERQPCALWRSVGGSMTKTSKGLLDWFKRKGLTPTGDSDKDMDTFREHAKVPKIDHKAK